jgi:hypothetical protein
MAAVPPPVVPAVVPTADIHAVLATCGIATEAHCTSIIVNKGFTSLADFGLLSEKDVFEMVKQNVQSYGCGGSHLCWNFASEKAPGPLLLGS